MRFASTAELKNRTNEMLRLVLSGDPVVITRHGRPVASLQRLDGDDLRSLASGRGAGSQTKPAARRSGQDVARSASGAAEYAYAVVQLPFGAFYVAYGPQGPVLARVATSAAAFERDAERYLGAPAKAASTPRWLADAVGAAVRRHEAFKGSVDLSRVGPFEREVLHALLRIPAGQVRTYGEIARAVGEPGAARAVGTACARNPLPLLIPCHRVVRSDGGLGGYSMRGGVDLKRQLLESEGALASLFA
jgi:methylated-DNA-[protein]-cysteine S-methyltransferase